jgi:hypothetical protein
LFTAALVHHHFGYKKMAIDYPERQASLQEFIQTAVIRDPRDPKIVMSISVLLEILLEFLTTRCESLYTSEYVQGIFAKNNFFQKCDSIPYWRVREHGWCPSELTTIFERLNCAGIHFMSHVERPNPTRKHEMIRIRPALSSKTSGTTANNEPTSDLNRSSNLCTAHMCSFLQLQDETYQTKHAEGCTGSGCYDMVADPNEILRILKNGSIPLILSLDSEDQNETLTILESGPDVEYVAIPHVWSDGMGNVQRSALPRCQILRLSRFIRNLPGKASDLLAFWVDTIGCPPDEAGQNEAQELAISMMRQTYENAKAVLVLDSWLLTQRIDGMPDHEILMKIICCTWNSRLWTLQEGALARTLLFQFADGSYDIDEGIIRLHNIDEPTLRCSLKAPISARAHEIRGFAKARTDLVRKLDALRGALSFRSTSVVTGEPLCLATLLNLDILEIIRIPKDDRIVKFWSLLDEVPTSLVFHNHPRLKVDGYRWAPQTFLRGPKSRGIDNTSDWLGDSPTAKPTKNGLLFQSPGMVMAINGFSIGETFLVKDEDGNLYRFNCRVEGADGAVEYDHTNPDYKYFPAGYDADEIYGDLDTRAHKVNPARGRLLSIYVLYR